MKSRLLAGSAALVLAIVGALMIISYAQGADQRAISNLEPVPVLVVRAAIPAGTPVESMAASLVTEQLPAAAVTESAVSSLDGSAGKVAAVDLVPGEQLVNERLVAPADLKAPGSVDVPEGLQEVSFQLEPQRVVGGRINAGDHVGIALNFDEGAYKAKTEDETTQLTVRKALVTAVQRAPQAASSEEAGANANANANANAQDTTLPEGSLMLTVAVSDIDAAKIIFTSINGSLWLTKEPLDAQDNGPRVERREVVYK